MSQTGGFDEVNRALDAYAADLRRRTEAFCGELGAMLETYCKNTAPFHDWTTNLRNSIKGADNWEEVSPGVYRIVLSAGMEYAVYVELGHGGKHPARPYAFLWPTVMHFQGQVARMWAERLGH